MSAYDISGDDILGDILVGEMEGEMEGDSIVGDMEGLLDLSGEELQGEMDGDDVLGLRNPFRRRRQNPRDARKARIAAMRRAIMERKIARGTLVQSLRPVAERNLFLGFTQTGIAASALATITVQPQLPFKGYRLSIPGQITPFFILADIKVGKDSQLVSPGSVPAQSFVETSVGDNISMDTADVGQLISLQVQNIDAAAAHDFRATLFGKTVLMGRVAR